MTVADYPPGEWSAILVGAQWVSRTTVEILDNAVVNRNTVVAHFADLYRTLHQAVDTTLAKQEGATADATRDAFRTGADQAFEVVRKNQAYAQALQKSVNAVVTLRGQLTDIAEKGNQQIRDIQQSKADTATKVAQITEVIANSQRDANQRALACAGEIMDDAGQNVLNAQGTGQSFRALAHAAGSDNVNRQPDSQAIEAQVRDQLNQPAPQGLMEGTRRTAPAAPAGSGLGANGETSGGGPAGSMPGGPPPAPAAASPQTTRTGAGGTPGGVAGAPQPAPAAATPQTTRTGMGGGPGGAIPANPAGFGTGGGGGGSGFGAPPVSATPPSMGGVGSAPMGGMGAPTGFGAPTNAAPGVAPPGLGPGAPTGAPMPPGAPGLPGGPVQAMASQLPPTAPTFPASAANAPITEIGRAHV